MRLLNRGDEAILYEILKKHIFTKTSKSDFKTLRNFYLGYCSSEDHLESKDFSNHNHKVILRSQGYFLPLMSDWFIRPLYYLEHL